jgi:long-chain acyl-CoA synthetase
MMHAGGFSNLVASVHAGARLVLAPSFDPDAVLDTIEQRRCTYFAGLPFMFDALVGRQLAEPRDVASATSFHAGGDAVTPALQSRFEAVFSHPLREGYGITEAGRITHQPVGRPVRVGSIGVPLEGVEVRIADPAGHEARVGQPGELMIRTPAMMSGYWREPEATVAALQDGWLRSGDIARRDADGYLWFLGRKKEIIVRGGSNIAPQEVESVLARHPAVLESAVVGLPDAVLGERVVAVVRPSPEIEASQADILGFVRTQLADYKTPETVIFRDDLPKNPGGKVHRLLIRQALLSDLARLPEEV